LIALLKIEAGIRQRATPLCLSLTQHYPGMCSK